MTLGPVSCESRRVGAALLFPLAFGLNYSLKQHEKARCGKWQSRSFGASFARRR